jgi:hypothetical protein
VRVGLWPTISVNIHAAAAKTSWCGTDFNPAQAGFARELSIGSGADMRLYDEAFVVKLHEDTYRPVKMFSRRPPHHVSRDRTEDCREGD